MVPSETSLPVGNTPTINLTGSIPLGGQDAAVLLLVNGDVRDMLFTTYCRPASGE